MARERAPHEVDPATIDDNARSPEIATFAKTLNRLMVEKHIHQEDMAQALGIATGSVSAYRNGKKEPRLPMIVKIANFLGVDCHYLMTGVRAENYVSAKQIGLSEEALEVLLKLRNSKITTETLNSLLIQPEFDQWLFQIYRIAGEAYTCHCLKEKAILERSKMDSPRITTLAESASQHIVVPEMENAETQELKRHYKLIEGAVNDLCKSGNTQKFGKNSVDAAINAYKARYKLEG